MKNHISEVNKTHSTPSSSLNTEKKQWQLPQITQLNVQDTKGGFIQLPFEDAWNIFRNPS